MKLYLDLCVYNRAFDDQHQGRIALETNAFIYILEKVEKGGYEPVLSEALIKVVSLLEFVSQEED